MKKEIESDVETSTKPKIKKSVSLCKLKTEIIKEIAESTYKTFTEAAELEESDETDRIFKGKVEKLKT